MKLSQFKHILGSIQELHFILPNGERVAKHFHITEAGISTKHFIDCGGTERTETKITFQLWVAHDYEHRLKPKKLLKIIDVSKSILGNHDHEIVIEYQQETVSLYGLNFDGKNFVLTSRNTACLALDACGVSLEDLRIDVVPLGADCCAGENFC